MFLFNDMTDSAYFQRCFLCGESLIDGSFMGQYTTPIAVWRTDRLLPFPRTLARNETHVLSSKIRIRVTDFISYHDTVTLLTSSLIGTLLFYAFKGDGIFLIWKSALETLAFIGADHYHNMTRQVILFYDAFQDNRCYLMILSM